MKQRITSFIVSVFLFLLIMNPIGLLAQTDSATRSLDFYVETAVKKSPLLKDYANQILSSRLDSLVIHAQNRPQVNANIGAMYAPYIPNTIFGYDYALTNGGNYAVQIAATQNILNKNILKPQYEAVHLQGQVVKNTAKLSEHDLKHNVISQYLTAWIDYKAIQTNRETLKLLNEEFGILKPLVETGQLKQTAFLSFNMEKQNGDLNLQQAQLQYQIDLMTLNIMVGLEDTFVSVRLTNPELSPNTIRYNYFNSAIYQQYHLDSLQLINQKELIDIRYKPKLNWIADAGFLSVSPEFFLHPGFSLGFGLSVPVFDGHQRKIEYDRIGLQERTRLNYIYYYKSQYNLQFVMLNNQLNATKALTKKYEDQLRANDNLIKISRIALNTGDISVTDFIVLLRSEIDLKNNLNQSRLKIAQIINDLNYYNWN